MLLSTQKLNPGESVPEFVFWEWNAGVGVVVGCPVEVLVGVLFPHFLFVFALSLFVPFVSRLGCIVRRHISPEAVVGIIASVRKERQA